MVKTYILNFAILFYVDCFGHVFPLRIGKNMIVYVCIFMRKFPSDVFDPFYYVRFVSSILRIQLLPILNHVGWQKKAKVGLRMPSGSKRELQNTLLSIKLRGLGKKVRREEKRGLDDQILWKSDLAGLKGLCSGPLIINPLCLVDFCTNFPGQHLSFAL